MELTQMQSQEIGEIAAALSAAQGELPAAIKNAVNPHLKNKYADLNALYEAIRQVMPKHDLAIIQTMIPSDGTKAHIRTTIAHKSGQWFAGECVMPADRQGGIQGLGSAYTYARRYSLAALVGIVTDEDDDGNAAQGRTAKGQREQAKANNPDPMTPEQSKMLMAYLTQKHGNNREGYLKELSDFFGKTILSSRELTKAMTSKFLDAVNNGSETQGAH